MKNKITVIGMMVLVLSFALVFAACSDDSGGDPIVLWPDEIMMEKNYNILSDGSGRLTFSQGNVAMDVHSGVSYWPVRSLPSHVFHYSLRSTNGGVFIVQEFYVTGSIAQYLDNHVFATSIVVDKAAGTITISGSEININGVWTVE